MTSMDTQFSPGGPKLRPSQYMSGKHHMQNMSCGDCASDAQNERCSSAAPDTRFWSASCRTCVCLNSGSGWSCPSHWCDTKIACNSRQGDERGQTAHQTSSFLGAVQLHKPIRWIFQKKLPCPSLAGTWSGAPWSATSREALRRSSAGTPARVP